MTHRLLLLTLIILGPLNHALGCPTTQVNFDLYVSRSAAIQAPLRQPEHRFEEIKAAAHRYLPALIYDSASQIHEMHFLIWHTPEQVYGAGYMTNYSMDVYMRSRDVLGADPNAEPLLIASAVIWASRDDQPTNWLGSAFLDFDPQFLCSTAGVCGWANGARPIKFRVSFYPIIDLAYDLPQRPMPSFSQNGSLNGCPGASDQDVDGDGSYDPVAWNKLTGEWSIRNSGTIVPTVTRKVWGRRGDIPFTADFTADHKADLVVFRPSNMTFYVCRSEAQFDCNQSIGVQLGLPGDEPLKGDFNDDGVYDLAVFNGTRGIVSWWDMTASRVDSLPFGARNDRPAR